MHKSSIIAGASAGLTFFVIVVLLQVFGVSPMWSRICAISAGVVLAIWGLTDWSLSARRIMDSTEEISQRMRDSLLPLKHMEDK